MTMLTIIKNQEKILIEIVVYTWISMTFCFIVIAKAGIVTARTIFVFDWDIPFVQVFTDWLCKKGNKILVFIYLYFFTEQTASEQEMFERSQIRKIILL